METEILTACDRLMTAAMNGVCQGIILAALVALGMRLAGRTNAATRHAIWFFTLILLAGLMPANCLRDFFFQSKESAATPSALLALYADGTEGAAFIDEAAENSVRAPLDTDFADRNVRAPINSGPAADDYPLTAESEYANNTFTAVLPDSREVPRKSRNHEPQASIVVLPDGASRLDGAPYATPRHNGPGHDNELGKVSGSPQPVGFWSRAEWLLSPISWNLNSAASIPWFISLVLLTFWLSVAGAHALLLLCRLGQIRKLKAKSFPPDTALDLCFRELCQELAIRRNVRLKLSYAPRSPMVLGFVHPVILLPAEPGKTVDRMEAEHILRHELAHVRRRDDWANLAQHLIQAIFFFHPGVWWISRQLGLEREFACDDYVLEQGGRPRAYALLLANLASRLSSRPLRLAPGVSTNKSQLQQRINMILDTRRNTSPRLAKTRLGLVTSAAAMLAVLSIYAMPRLVLAQAEPARAGAPVAPPANPTSPSVASAGTSSQPEAAEAAPATPAPVAAESGPRFKSEPIGDVPRLELAPVTRPIAVPVPSLPPQAAVTPFTPAPPYIAANQLPGQPGAMPRRPRGPDGNSIEERLARLEEMVHSLMAEAHAGHPSAEVFARKHAEHDELINKKELERIQQFAEREAARAADQAKRAAEQAERGLRDSEARRGQGKRPQEMWAKQIESLQKQREALERQMEHLERQIEKLEQEQEKLNEQEENQAEDKQNEEKQEEEKQSEDKHNGECESKAVEAPAEK